MKEDSARIRYIWQDVSPLAPFSFDICRARCDPSAPFFSFSFRCWPRFARRSAADLPGEVVNEAR
jgi:hypothetical protein